MIITHQGVQSFRVQFGDTVLAFDPISKDSKHKSSNFGADIALVSLNHPDMNGIPQVSRGDKDVFVIKGPGEYEVQGVFVRGVASVSNYDGQEKINTIYTVNLEGMNLCFLGALSDTNIGSEAKSTIDSVDILFVPISGEEVLNPADAYKFAISLEPSVIIPMNVNESSLKSFIKEGGSGNVETLDKLTIKKKDLDGKAGEILIISSE